MVPFFGEKKGGRGAPFCSLGHYFCTHVLKKRGVHDLMIAVFMQGMEVGIPFCCLQKAINFLIFFFFSWVFFHVFFFFFACFFLVSFINDYIGNK